MLKELLSDEGRRHLSEERLAELASAWEDPSRGRGTVVRDYEDDSIHVMLCDRCAYILARERQVARAARAAEPSSSPRQRSWWVEGIPDGRAWVIRAALRVSNKVREWTEKELGGTPSAQPALAYRYKEEVAPGPAAEGQRPARLERLRLGERPEINLALDLDASFLEMTRLSLAPIEEKRQPTVPVEGWNAWLSLADGRSFGPATTGPRGAAYFNDLPFDPEALREAEVRLESPPLGERPALADS